jgi:formate dehydrogenase (coenzyme F420) beta subunit
MPEKMKDELIAIVSKLFDEGRIHHFLGYKKGTVKFKTTPLIALNREDLQGLWVEDFFATNLALYLKEIKGRVGLLVKGCDSRSLVSLIKEGQVRREDLYVVGIPCPGQIDPGKVAEAALCEREELEEIFRKGAEVLIRANGQEKTLPKTRVLLDKCLDCSYPQPLIFDSLLPGEYVAPVSKANQPEDDLRKKPVPEKWAVWAEQFQRCIRCYACRNVCPACFCPRCIVEENMPQWISPLPTGGDNFVFHLMRLMHVAGSCTSCGECQRVCPMGIPLMKLNDKMADDLRELFDFVAGVDLDKPLPFRTYRQDDADDFIK